MVGTVQQFDYSVDLLRSLLWEYNEAVNLQGLQELKQDWFNENQSAFWNDWLTDVFNLATANDFGLTVWSIILGQPIYLSHGVAPVGYPAWGFGSFHKNFSNGNFANRDGFAYRFPTYVSRIILQLRYFQLTSAGCVPEINRMLKYVFGSFGPVYLKDNLDMTQTYVFGFTLPAELQLAFDNFDILPRPSGVKSNYVQGNIPRFGFGQFHANFSNGNFYGA